VFIAKTVKCLDGSYVGKRGLFSLAAGRVRDPGVPFALPLQLPAALARSVVMPEVGHKVGAKGTLKASVLVQTSRDSASAAFKATRAVAAS